MKSYNIVKKLEEQGYQIIYKKWGYWDNIPHVELDGFDFTIAEKIWSGNLQGCRIDFIFNEVQQALYIAQKNNPIILKKIEQVPWEKGYYGRYLIISMEDYYQYKKDIYPFNEYYQVLNKLKKEFK